MHPGKSRSRRGQPAAVSGGGRHLILPVAFALFVVVVALTGGSSRPDVVALILLRPVAVLFIVAMLVVGNPDWRRIAPLPVLLALFAATMALQLVPVPPSLWLGLSGRAKFDAVARMLGEADGWRPLALSPSGVWNSLAALLVPLATMMAFAALDEPQRRRLLLPMLGIVAFSMLLGIAQVAGGSESPLYWYKISGNGQLLGLFANRNHQGALLAMALPLLRVWMLAPADDHRTQRVRAIAGIAAGGTIFLYALILGSRAGLALTVAGVVAAWLVEPSIGLSGRSARVRWLITAAILAGLAGVLVLVLDADRAVSINRMVDNDLSTEARFERLPTLLHIVRDVLPMGTGFGSFVPVWASYEPDALLEPSYFNNAHNDLIELAITGGLPALAVMAGFLAWWIRAGWQAFARPGHAGRYLKRASALAILIALLASLVDYPLRTPLMSAIVTILCCWLSHKSDRTLPTDADLVTADPAARPSAAQQ